MKFNKMSLWAFETLGGIIILILWPINQCLAYPQEIDTFSVQNLITPKFYLCPDMPMITVLELVENLSFSSSLLANLGERSVYLLILIIFVFISRDFRGSLRIISQQAPYSSNKKRLWEFLEESSLNISLISIFLEQISYAMAILLLYGLFLVFSCTLQNYKYSKQHSLILSMN